MSDDDDLERLRRIESQVRGLQRLVEDHHSCVDLLKAINAVTQALQVVALHVLDQHLHRNVRDGAPNPRDPDSVLDEAWKAIEALLRT